MSSPPKRALIAIGALAVIAAVVFYIYYERYARFLQETDDARIQADQVVISSKLAGYVRSIPVADNQPVSEGSELVKIDTSDFEAQLNAADAQMAASRSAELAARQSERESEAGILQAQAGLKAARASLDYARREVNRYEPLVRAGSEPQSTLSRLIADRDRAEAEVAAQVATLEQTKRRLESLAAQSRNLAAQGGTAKAQRRIAANNLAYTTIRAPINGIAANRGVRVGQYVQPGMRLMTIVPNADLYVVANFKETQVGLMRPGQPAIIRVDALPGVEFSGKVSSITPGTGENFSLIKPDNATGNFTKIVQRVPVRINFNAGAAAHKILVPGMSLVVEVDTRSGRDEMNTLLSEQE